MLAFEDSFSPKPFTFLVNLTCILYKALWYLIKSFPCLKRRYCHCCCCRCSLVKQHMKNRRKNRQRRCRNHVPTEKLTSNPNSNRYSEVMVKTRPDYHNPYDAKCFNGPLPSHSLIMWLDVVYIKHLTATSRLWKICYFLFKQILYRIYTLKITPSVCWFCPVGPQWVCNRNFEQISKTNWSSFRPK